MGPELQYLLILTRGHLSRVKDDERGVSAVEWVIITVALAALALAVAALISTRIKDKAGSLNLG